MAQEITLEDVNKLNDPSMMDEKNRLASFKKWAFKKGKCTKEKVCKMFVF